MTNRHLLVKTHVPPDLWQSLVGLATAAERSIAAEVRVALRSNVESAALDDDRRALLASADVLDANDYPALADVERRSAMDISARLRRGC